MAIAKRELEEPLEHVIDPSLQQELLKHPGKWAAITRSELIGVFDTLIEAQRAGEDREVILHYIPKDRGAVYFY